MKKILFLTLIPSFVYANCNDTSRSYLKKQCEENKANVQFQQQEITDRIRVEAEDNANKSKRFQELVKSLSETAK